jgi:hypothetical protein
MTTFVVVGFALVVVVMFAWPTAAAARRMLRRWRVSEPRPDQVAEALSYLRRRRFWYPWLLALGLFTLAPHVDLLLASVLAALLIAELLALRSTRARLRTATLAPRAAFDLVPRRPAALLAILATVTAILALLAIGIRASVEVEAELVIVELDVVHPDRSAWLLLGATAACLIAVGVVWQVAVLRPASGDPEVDAVLRIRSARVAVALGLALQALLLAASVQVVGGYHADLLSGVVPAWFSELGVWINWMPVVAFCTSLSVWRSLVTPATKRSPAAR